MMSLTVRCSSIHVEDITKISSLNRLAYPRTIDEVTLIRGGKTVPHCAGSHSRMVNVAFVSAMVTDSPD
jgi:hypothetical protein